MKLYAPKYCETFKCTADKCSHSCCIGWQIYVDTETLDFHKSSHHPVSKELISSLKCADEGEYIELTNDGRCPFLDSSGLCRIHSALGEARTSRICREHPRFYHKIGDRYEMGIGASCEAAVRLILDARDPFDMTLIERESDCAVEENSYDATFERDAVYSLISSAKSFDEALAALMKKYIIPAEIFESDELESAINELELLDDTHREILRKAGTNRRKCNERFTKSFLSYLVFRHVSTARSYDDVRVALAFSIALTNMLSQAPDALVYEYARIISEEIEYSEDNTYNLLEMLS